MSDHCGVIARVSIALSLLLILGTPGAARPQSQNSQKEKLPKARELDSGVVWRRDASTGELRAITEHKTTPGEGPEGADAAAARAAIRRATQMVAVTCMVATKDGTPVPGLARTDFRVYEDGAAQQLAYFDASNQPASVAIVIDASPSVLRDSDEMKAAADALIDTLAPLDQAAVVDFAWHTYLQLPFSDVRELLRHAVARINVRELFSDAGGSNIYEAVYLTARELFPARAGRKAIVLLTDGQDSGLGLTMDAASARPSPAAPNKLTFDDVTRLLASEDVQVFAVSTENRPKIMTTSWLAAHAGQTLITPDDRESHIPPYTLYLAELVRRAGGQLYFLREAPTLADTFRQIAQRIRAEYTLGYYPQATQEGSTPAMRAGWHKLGVELPGQPNVVISNRAAYYLPATQ